MNKPQNDVTRIITMALRSARDANTIDDIESLARDAAMAVDAVSKPAYTASAETGAKPGEVEAVVGKSYDSGFEAEVRNALDSMTRAIDEMREKEKEKERAIGREEEKRREEDKKAKDEDVKIKEEAAATKAEALDELTAKLTGDADKAKEEEAVTVKAETIDAMGATGNASVPSFSSSRDTAVNLIQALKPTIASIKDANDRKRVIDSIVNAMEPLTNGPAMKDVMQVANHNARAMDASVEENLETYQNAYDARNPHVMAKKGVAQ